MAPDESPKDYYNRKGWFSLDIQALVDSRYRFMDLCIGRPGSVYDTRVLSRSEVYNRREAGTLVGDLRHIAGVDVVADSRRRRVPSTAMAAQKRYNDKVVIAKW